MQNLQDYLKENQKYSPFWEGGLANHLPMALTALHEIGGADEDLKAFYNYYLPNLEIGIKTQKLEINNDNWSEFLGSRIYFWEYLEFFEKEVKILGFEETLKTFLPNLIPGLLASKTAFHGLIRTSYGVISKNDFEVAIGLAMLATYFSIIAKVVERKDKRKIQEIILTLQQNDELQNLDILKEGLIADVLAPVLINESFLESVSQINFKNVDLESLSIFSLQLYYTKPNIQTLHTVTSAHALRILLPYLEDKNLAIAYLWQAVLAIMVGNKITIIEDFLNLVENVTWEKILENARKIKDDHFIKLTYTLFEENRIYNKPDYLAVAQSLYQKSLNEEEVEL